jgi:acetylornithine deacetylase/succinyl-diaminopimelate desuccinylase-like protein
MNIDTYLKKNKNIILNDFLKFLEIPSITNFEKDNKNILKITNYLKSILIKAGVDKVLIFKTKKHPILYAEKLIDSKKPTILIYGHYDVVHASNEDDWFSNPFIPITKNKKIYARGASDNKGPLFAHIKAFEYLNKTNALKFNVKFIFEGEEESGSPNLRYFLKKNKNIFNVKDIIISDTEILSETLPSITTGLRGIVTMKIKLIKHKEDYHSGMYGGIIENPIFDLCKLISKLKNKEGKITIPNFYEDVIEISKTKHNETILNTENKNNKKIISKINYFEKSSLEPSIDINSIWGGHIGKGTKTIIPKHASAKISLRIVPNQNTKKIINLTIKYLKSICQKNSEIKITNISGINPYSIDFKNKNLKIIENAYKSTYKATPLMLRSGVCIAAANIFKNELNISPLLMGFILTSDRIHSNNEHIKINQLFMSIKTIINFYKYYSENN